MVLLVFWLFLFGFEVIFIFFGGMFFQMLMFFFEVAVVFWAVGGDGCGGVGAGRGRREREKVCPKSAGGHDMQASEHVSKEVVG